MSEVDSAPENIKIPDNWEFPDRGTSGLNVNQIDLDGRFLAFTVPDGEGFRRVEHFFNSAGDISGYLIIPDAMAIKIGLSSGETKALYQISRRYTARGSISSSEFGDILIDLVSSKTDYLSSNYLDYEEVIGDFTYSEDEKLYVMGGEAVFLEGESYIESPMFYLGWDSLYRKYKLGVTDPREYDSNTKEYTTGNFVLHQPSEQKLEVFDKDKEQVFEIEWGWRAGNREEGRRESLLVSQKHNPTGIVKILEAPLTINHNRIAEAINTSPPYKKEKAGEKEQLVVPWRNIDRIIGVSLSYSYPPPTSQK